MFVVLLWLFALTPLLCWALLARTRLVGAAVGVVLAGLAAALLALDHDLLFSRAAVEAHAGYPVAAATVILAGALAERRLRGPRPAAAYGNRAGAVTAALAAHTLTAAVGVAAWSMFLGEPYYPGLAELPLPAGLRIASDTGTSPGCALGGCTRTLALAAPAGESPAEAAERLRAQLAGRGWTPGPGGCLQHPHGWLLDDRRVQVWISPGEAGVQVDLVGADLYH
ncbi:hypothetical protein [Kitasatospora herbaricolor]|uniref:Uncharacterized protein n=1 Tax=Kitasatospora herbaricolor TaxID=68217 RepID=A0ABZ1W7I1_9ACTN|nr:hypothetical protein [Kitasatospora herbaricolor]